MVLDKDRLISRHSVTITRHLMVSCKEHGSSVGKVTLSDLDSRVSFSGRGSGVFHATTFRAAVGPSGWCLCLKWILAQRAIFLLPLCPDRLCGASSFPSGGHMYKVAETLSWHLTLRSCCVTRLWGTYAPCVIWGMHSVVDYEYWKCPGISRRADW